MDTRAGALQDESRRVWGSLWVTPGKLGSVLLYVLYCKQYTCWMKSGNDANVPVEG